MARVQRIDRRRFELLKRAYVEARYSESFEIGLDDLEALTASVHRLRDVVEAISGKDSRRSGKPPGSDNPERGVDMRPGMTISARN
jgi:hypothetical protein